MMYEDEQWKSELCTTQREANRDLEAALASTMELSLTFCLRVYFSVLFVFLPGDGRVVREAGVSILS